MEVRFARSDELPWLEKRVAESGGVAVDMNAARVWVAVEDEKIVGLVAAQMVWHMEPILVFPECRNRITRSRATYRMFVAACTWLGDRSRNRSGIHWLFGVSRSRAVAGWAKRVGLLRQYKGAATYTKYL